MLFLFNWTSVLLYFINKPRFPSEIQKFFCFSVFNKKNSLLKCFKFEFTSLCIANFYVGKVKISSKKTCFVGNNRFILDTSYLSRVCTIAWCSGLLTRLPWSFPWRSNKHIFAKNYIYIYIQDAKMWFRRNRLFVRATLHVSLRTFAT